MERCALERIPTGHRLSGTVLLSAEGGPHEIRYSVTVDEEWNTRIAGAHVRGPGRDDRVALVSDGAGMWTADGDHVPDFDGCRDVDMEFTPATNLLPIRRLGLEIGQSAPVEAAWVRFPERRALRLAQTYTRTGDDAYRYESPGFVTEITLHDDGLPVSYGSLWERVPEPDA
jgi:hypothetical protein